MIQPKLDLSLVVTTAIRHFIHDGQPPALSENGKFGLRVHCNSEPLIRFDPVGLSIPEHLLDESAEDISIAELLEPDSPSYDGALADYFSSVPTKALQDLQDIHESIVRNNPDNFQALFTDALSKFIKKYELDLSEDILSSLNPVKDEDSPKEASPLKKSHRTQEEISAQVKKIQYLIDCRSVPTTKAIKFVGESISLFYSRKAKLEPLTDSEIEGLNKEFEGVDLTSLLNTSRKRKSDKMAETRLSKGPKKTRGKSNGDSSEVSDPRVEEKKLPEPSSNSEFPSSPQPVLEIERLREENRKLRQFILRNLEMTRPDRDVKDSLIDLLIGS